MRWLYRRRRRRWRAVVADREEWAAPTGSPPAAEP